MNPFTHPFRATLIFLTALALLSRAGATEIYSYTNLNRTIPDGNVLGVVDSRSITSSIVNVASIKLRLKIAGDYNGDLYCYLRQVDSSRTNLCVLLNRPGRTSANAFGYADSGFDVTFDDAAVTGDIHSYRSSTNLPAGLPLQGTWQPDGRKVDPSLCTDASARTTSLATFLRGSASGTWSLFVADVESGGTNMLLGWELEFSGKLAPPVTWPAPGDITYGTTLGAAQLNASSAVPGSFAYTPPAGTLLNSGSNQWLTAIFTPTDTNTYTSASNAVSVNVLKRALLITATSTNKTYGQITSFTGTEFGSSGLVSTDRVTQVSLSSAGSAAAATVSGSPYAIVASAAVGTGLTNYVISYANGSLTINPKALIVTASNTNKIYGQTLSFLGTEFISSGLISTDTVTRVTLTSPGGAGSASVTAIPYSIVPSAALGAGLGNYSITYSNGGLTVLQAATAASIASSSNPALPGSPVQFTCTLSILPAGSGTLGGTVQFSLNGTNSGSPVPVTGSSAAYSISLPAGQYTVSAQYLGNANLTGSSATLGGGQTINTPPVASSDSVERWANKGTKVSIASLLSNDSDADGDSVVFLSVNSTSANGGTISVNGSWLNYTPAGGFTNIDSFQYTVSDGHGGQANGTVQINVRASIASPTYLSVISLGNGDFRVHLDGIPDQAYRIQYTSDLVNPIWTDLMSGNADANGILEYVDHPASGQSRYYRSFYP